MHNPGAGDEDHSAEAVGSLIERAGHKVAYFSTDEPGWKRALDMQSDLIAIAGGDGTVGTVLAELAAVSPRLVTILPIGSANNIARAFQLTGRTPDELIAGWADAERRRYRLGEITAPDRREIFVETVGGGLFAESILRASQRENDDEDKVELGLRVLRELVDELPVQPWRVELDGIDYSGDFLAVEAMVIGDTGPKVPLAPAADPDDRLLDIVLIRDQDRDQLASYLDDRLHRRRSQPLSLTVKRSITVVIAPSTERSMRIDDTLWETAAWIEDGGHARAGILGAPVELLVPR